MKLQAEPLNADSFAPFGSVVDAAALKGWPVNQGRARRANIPSPFEAPDGAIAPRLAIYEVQGTPSPIEIPVLERHPLSPQMFVPHGTGRYLVVVAPTDDEDKPDVAHARAFVGKDGLAVVYSKGTWHAPMFALDQRLDFMMAMSEAGDQRDTEEVSLAVPLEVIAPDVSHR
ncbi:ureidoglycolate hydrolase [Hyaloraphidium curvatum]|nr:ureidoglycolate hydrolase [Hyaloraphidium curvatum]